MTWKYLPVLHQCLTILLIVGLGYILGFTGVFDPITFVPVMVKFVFYVALPFLILQGLGVNINFYEDKYVWSFIGSFFVLRVMALVISVAITWLKKINNHSTPHDVGHVAVLWLCLSWISTVILGAPILGAIFNDTVKGQSYGILAAISSFVFQLPLQMILLEYHKVKLQVDEDFVIDEERSRQSMNRDPDLASISSIRQLDKHHDNDVENISAGDEVEILDPQTQLRIQNYQILRRVFYQMMLNPVLWGISGGFILSLSTLGPSFLKKPSIYGDWFTKLAEWLGGSVSPLSLFSMGVWMSSQRGIQYKISPYTVVLCMLSKLMFMPMMMVWISKLFNLNDEAGRASILIACLPISMASFSFGSRFEIGENLLSLNVILGTILVLPTVLLWNLVMDSLDLYVEYSGE